MVWLLLAVIIYAFAIAPVVPLDKNSSIAGRILVALFVTGPLLLCFYWCVIHGFQQLGVFHA